ncbi:unnamed protein product, partial [Meganyctiphanes norvegica]
RSWPTSRARTFECPERGLFCNSCTTAAFCTGAGVTPIVVPCGSGEVCGGIAPAVGCLNYVTSNAGYYDCDSIGNSGFLVDIYDPSNYMLCIPPNSQLFLSCPYGEIFDKETNRCTK